jgi:competence protein ComEA
MKNGWKEYLTFTKKERTGIITLLVLIAVVTVLPLFFTSTPPLPDKAEWEKLQAQLALSGSNQADSFQQATRKQRRKHASVMDEPASLSGTNLFEFDPNNLQAAGWKRLGLSDRIVHTIRNYLAKGGHFRKPEDLGRIYGIKKTDVARLLPYVKIESPAAHADQKGQAVKPGYPPKPVIAMVDINVADTTAWIALPGIGSKLAQRICHFRERLGGFYSIEQVAETYGLPDSTFQLIQPYLQFSAGAVKKLNINTVDVNELKQHPYIRWQVANAIVQYRQQHGLFQSTADLQKIMLITPEIFQKIAPYVIVE